MANLKDLIVNGATRILGGLFVNGEVKIYSDDKLDIKSNQEMSISTQDSMDISCDGTLILETSNNAIITLDTDDVTIGSEDTSAVNIKAKSNSITICDYNEDLKISGGNNVIIESEGDININTSTDNNLLINSGAELNLKAGNSNEYKGLIQIDTDGMIKLDSAGDQGIFLLSNNSEISADSTGEIHIKSSVGNSLNLSSNGGTIDIDGDGQIDIISSDAQDIIIKAQAEDSDGGNVKVITSGDGEFTYNNKEVATIGTCDDVIIECNNGHITNTDEVESKMRYMYEKLEKFNYAILNFEASIKDGGTIFNMSDCCIVSKDNFAKAFTCVKFESNVFHNYKVSCDDEYLQIFYEHTNDIGDEIFNVWYEIETDTLDYENLNNYITRIGLTNIHFI